MDLFFTIINHKLKKESVKVYPNKSNNYLRLFFDFITGDWDNVTKFIILKNHKNKAYQFSYDVDGLKVPVDILNGNRFYVTVYGVNNDEELRITTNEVRIGLVGSGFTNNIESIEEYSADIWEQLFDELNNKQDSNLATSLDNSDDNSYPSTRCVKDYITNIIGDIKEDMLL